MNFFSHAVVASWYSDSRDFALGAMLPDFATMISTKKPLVTNEAVLQGMRFHEQTDAVFHDTREFRELLLDAQGKLRRAGVRKGSALAAAHIGVELLIDSELANQAPHYVAFSQALEAATSTSLTGAMRWSDAEAEARYLRLCARLQETSRNRPQWTGRLVADRVRAAVAQRARLALDESAHLSVESWADTAQADVREKTPSLLLTLETGLSRLGLTVRETMSLERTDSNG